MCCCCCWKRDLEREISTTVGRDWIFFLAEVSKYKASRWSIFSRLSLNKIPAESYPFIQSQQLFISPEQWNYTSVSTKLFRGIMNSASFDQSITALVLILGISRLTRLLRESSCHANRWTDNTRLFRALQSRNWNTRFCSTKKKTERQAKTSKKVKLHSNKTVSSR